MRLEPRSSGYGAASVPLAPQPLPFVADVKLEKFYKILDSSINVKNPIRLTQATSTLVQVTNCCRLSSNLDGKKSNQLPVATER